MAWHAGLTIAQEQPLLHCCATFCLALVKHINAPMEPCVAEHMTAKHPTHLVREGCQPKCGAWGQGFQGSQQRASGQLQVFLCAGGVNQRHAQRAHDLLLRNSLGILHVGNTVQWSS